MPTLSNKKDNLTSASPCKCQQVAELLHKVVCPDPLRRQAKHHVRQRVNDPVQDVLIIFQPEANQARSCHP